MLDSRNIHRRIKKDSRSAKFYSRFLGPFKIIKAEPDTSNYELELLPKVNFESIHPNFHSDLLVHMSQTILNSSQTESRRDQARLYQKILMEHNTRLRSSSITDQPKIRGSTSYVGKVMMSRVTNGLIRGIFIEI